MVTRTIYIGNPAMLTLKDNQMKILCPNQRIEKGSVAIEDLGFLMLDHFQITLTHQLIQKLMADNVVVVSCDAQHLPHGIMLPLYGHSNHSERVREQLSMSEPLKKQLWKQIVEQKIENQKDILKKKNKVFTPMHSFLENVKSGDSGNMEGIAAKHYWRELMGTDFLRERFGDGPNSFLNFGYAVLRSMVARSIVSTGLLPVHGIFHRNKYNPYCLADDLMEPFRPFIDLLVMDWIMQNDETALTKDLKAHLLRCATIDVKMEKQTHPLMVAIKLSCVSFYQCIVGEKRNLVLPQLP